MRFEDILSGRVAPGIAASGFAPLNHITVSRALREESFVHDGGAWAHEAVAGFCISVPMPNSNEKTSRMYLFVLVASYEPSMGSASPWLSISLKNKSHHASIVSAKGSRYMHKLKSVESVRRFWEGTA